MKEDNFENIWTEKLRMAEAFLESATVLSVPLKRVERGDSDEQLAEKREVCHFLCAFLFELAIKIIWEVENQKKCKPHHHILEFYGELSPERQSQIRQLYENQLDLVRRVPEVDAFAELQSLGDALKANPDTVKNFKYERDFHGKSSVVSGLIWKECDGYVTLPSQYIIFPTEIMRYVRECVGSHP